MDDDQKFEATLAAAYAKAPKEVQAYISSGEFEKFIERVKGQYRLPPAVLAEVGNETLMVLVGVLPMEELPISVELARVPREVRSSLLEDMKKNVFDPLAAKVKTPATSSPVSVAPVKPVPPPAPINRLAQPATPKLLPKHEDVKPVTPPVVQKIVPAAPPVLQKMPTVPVVKPLVPPIKPPVPIAKSIAPQIEPKPVVASPVAVPKPPLVAPVPSAETPKAPSAPALSKAETSPKRVDPYREPVE